MRTIMKVFVLKGGKGENFSYILKVGVFRKYFGCFVLYNR